MTSMLERKIANRTAVIAIIGLGYVGLPLALAALAAGYTVHGIDNDARKVARILKGEGPDHLDLTPLLEARAQGRFEASADAAGLGHADVAIICVPTPLSRQREPDLSHVLSAARSVAEHLRKGQLIALESTTYPGTTTGVIRPMLEAGGLKSGVDFFLAFSPEREDPGNAGHSTRTIPKVVGGDGAEALRLADMLYASLVAKTVPVSSPAVAEAVKLTENIFRSVNIALVNELKVIFDAMGIDIWEVIDAAKTKPFGYMPFYPGPGLGGHCISIDPFYLTWKAREFDLTTRFIELAGQINTAMPHYVLERTMEALSKYRQRAVNGAKLLVLGVAYKKNIGDTRESPALKLMELLEARGADVVYHDPYVPTLDDSEYHGRSASRSVPLAPEMLGQFDACLITTDHDGVDYEMIAKSDVLVVDTRNAMGARGLSGERIVKA